MTQNDNQIQRAQWHDYRAPGFYMITMVTEGRRKAFGRIDGDSESAAHVELTAIGYVLEQSILAIHDYYPEVEVVEYIVMEDHCHCCLQVKEHLKKHLGAVVGTLKTATTKRYLHEENLKRTALCLTPPQDKRDERRQAERISKVQVWLRNGAAEPPATGLHAEALTIWRLRQEGRCPVSDGSAVTNEAIGDIPVLIIPPLWQQGYHDRIVMRHGQIADQRRYIRRNPARMWLKRHANGDVTRVRMIRQRLPLILARRLKDTATHWDQRRDVYHSPFAHRHEGEHYARSYVELVQKFLRYNADTREIFLKLRQCGDGSMLESGRPLVRVRISRSVTREQFHAEVHRILDVCEREGAIAISPFRSWSEKAVLQILRMNGYHHIIIHGEAMWDGWKPQDGSTATHHQTVPSWFTTDYQPYLHSDKGDLAEVYAGHCLILAPWHDRPRCERAGKADCEVMNEMCKVMEDTGGGREEKQ